MAAQTYTEKLFSIMLMFVAVLIYSVMIGTITSQCGESNEMQKIQDEKRVVFEKILNEFEIPKHLIVRVKNSISFGFTEVNRDEEAFIS